MAQPPLLRDVIDIKESISTSDFVLSLAEATTPVGAEHALKDYVVTERLLENFDDTAARITKVLPRDYAAVLQTRLDAIEEGLDPDGEEVWSRILEVTGG